MIDKAQGIACPACEAGPGEKCRDLRPGHEGEHAPGVLSHRERAEAWAAWQQEARGRE